MYQALYRKWRPTVFEDVVGQPQVTVTLRHALAMGRISHAYLFTGSRGTGKTTCAKILAKAVNCLSPVEGDPCGVCDLCKEAEQGELLDIVEIDAASNNGVDHIRALREEAAFTPAKGKYRVYIIDEVHMLSQGAFNALLKTLEEPPAHVVFILATTEVHKLPATILSRCQRFDFRRIPPEDIANRLQYITEQEGGTLKREGALLIARLSDGALRDALSILDQCLGQSKAISLSVVEETVGMVGRGYLFTLTSSLIAGESGNVLEQLDTSYQSSKDMFRLCEELCSHLRYLLLCRAGTVAPLSVLSQEEQAELQAQSQLCSTSFLLHGIDALTGAMEKMSRGANQRITLELTLLRLCDPQLDDSPAALLRRVERVEQGRGAMAAPVTSPALAQEMPQAEGKAAAPSSPKTAEKAKEQTAESATKGNIASLSAKAVPFPQWNQVLGLLREQSPSMAASFHGSSAYVSPPYLLVEAGSSTAFALLRQEENRNKMRQVLRQATGEEYKLGPYQAAPEQKEQHPFTEIEQRAIAAGIPVAVDGKQEEE